MNFYDPSASWGGNYSDYVPSSLVRRIHNWPHLDANLVPGSNNFQVYYSTSIYSMYIRSCASLPIVFGSCIIFGVLVMRLCITCRILIADCRCAPNPIAMNPVEYIKWTQRVIITRRALLFFFVLFTCTSVVAINIYFFSNGIQRGRRSMDLPLQDELVAYGVTKDLGYDLFDVFTQVKDIADVLEVDQCAFVQFYRGYLNDMNTRMMNLIENVDYMQGTLSGFMDTTFLWIGRWDEATWGFWVPYILVVVLFFVGLLRFEKKWMQAASVLGETLILAMAIILIVELTIMIGFADFCIDPKSNAVQLVRPGDPLRITNYYMHCNTSNPFEPILEQIDSLIDPIKARVDLILRPNHAGCSNHPDLEQTLVLLVDMRHMIGNMTENTNICEPRMNRWNQVFYQSVCTEIFNGYFFLTIGQGLSSVSLFMLCCVGCVIYHYFGDYWALTFDGPLPDSLKFEIPRRDDLKIDDPLNKTYMPLEISRDGGFGSAGDDDVQDAFGAGNIVV